MMMREGEREREREREGERGRLSAEHQHSQQQISGRSVARLVGVGRSVGCQERSGRTDQEEAAGKISDLLRKTAGMSIQPLLLLITLLQYHLDMSENYTVMQLI